MEDKSAEILNVLRISTQVFEKLQLDLEPVRDKALDEVARLTGYSQCAEQIIKLIVNKVAQMQVQIKELEDKKNSEKLLDERKKLEEKSILSEKKLLEEKKQFEEMKKEIEKSFLEERKHFEELKKKESEKFAEEKRLFAEKKNEEEKLIEEKKKKRKFFNWEF